MAEKHEKGSKNIEAVEKQKDTGRRKTDTERSKKQRSESEECVI